MPSPAAASSGIRVWATNLDGNHPNAANFSLITPVYALPESSQPEMEFQSWFDAQGVDFGFVEISLDGGATWEPPLEQLSNFQGDYLPKLFDLSAYAGPGSEIRIRFRMTSDVVGATAGWYIDDFAIRGVGKSVLFLDPTLPKNYDFETGDAGWTHKKLGGDADTWHLDMATCFGDPLGSTMFVSNGNAGPTCEDSTAHEFSRLLSPPILLPHSGSFELTFDAVAFDEGGACLASSDFDAKDVGITTDGGESYTVLNDCFPLVPFGSPLQHHVFDISAFAGDTIQVIFVYDTRDAGFDHTFAVDNVVISQIE